MTVMYDVVMFHCGGSYWVHNVWRRTHSISHARRKEMYAFHSSVFR